MVQSDCHLFHSRWLDWHANFWASFLRILILFTFRIIYFLLHKFFSLFFISCNKNIVHFWKAYVFFSPSYFLFFLFSWSTLHQRVSRKSLVHSCPMKNSRECDWKTDVWVTVTQNLRSMGLDKKNLVRMCTYFNLEVWTLRQTLKFRSAIVTTQIYKIFFLKDFEEGLYLFTLVFIDSFLFHYFQMNPYED